MSGKNLLILVDGDFIGGAETNYRFILPDLMDSGWNPIFVCPDDQNLRAYFSSFGLDVRTEPGMERYPPFSVNGKTSVRNLMAVAIALRTNRRTVLKLIHETSARAVISNSMVSHLLNAALPADSSYRRIVHLHDIVDRRKAGGLYGRGIDWIAKRVDGIITISDAVIETIPETERSKSAKLYNPIGSMPARKRPCEGALRVGMFARYTPWKGHRDLIRIAAACEDAAVEFVSFGNVSENDRSYRSELETSLGALKEPERVRLNGFAPDPLQAMADCDFVLHLSTSPEPFGRVLIEANACGVPILAYRGGGVDELFENLKLMGERFDNGNWSAIADFLIAAADDESTSGRSATDPDAVDLSALYAEQYVSAFLEVCIGQDFRPA